MPRANASVLWDFFEKGEDKRGRCVLCGESYSYKTSTANLKSHLARNHNEAYRLVCVTQEQQRAELKSKCERNSGESHSDTLRSRQIIDLKEQLKEKHPDLFDSDKGDPTGDDEKLKIKYTITKNGTKEIVVEKKPENEESGGEEEWIEGEFIDCVKGDEIEDSSDDGGIKVFKPKRRKTESKTKLRRLSIASDKPNEDQHQSNIRFGQFVGEELGKFKGKSRAFAIQKIMSALLET